MEWTDVILEVPASAREQALAAALRFSDRGLYVEDYADLEEQVLAITHMDLIEQELLDKPRDSIKIHLYLSCDEPIAATLEKLGAHLSAIGVPYAFAQEALRQEDWENAWKRHYHPIEVGARLAVAPTWEAYPGHGRTVLRLDPGMAFGTGTHETTLLCLEALDEAVQGGERVLDIGTGSGILAVAALLLGAAEATGIDIDPMAVRTATENARRNGVAGHFRALEGDLAALARGQYQIITANIVADAIVRLAPALPPLLPPGGLFVASGIIDERAAEVEAALAKPGWGEVHRREKNGWVALLCRAG